MDINLEYYKVFYYVGKLGSITAAAEVLCISQPGVSQAVKQLETVIGCKLFVRTSKGVSLTKEGELLFTYASRGVESLMDGEKMLRRMADLDMGEVRIGASDMSLRYFLLPYLEYFHEQYPKVKVIVSNAPTPETIESLYEGKIDFGVVSTPFDSRAGVVRIPVKMMTDIFVAGDKFRYLEHQDLNYESLTGLPCILLEKRTSTRKFMDEFLKENQIVLEPEFELATSDMIVQFAKRNLGIGCVMSQFADKEIENGELFPLRFKQELPKRQMCVVTEDKNPISPAGIKLLQLFKDKPEMA